MFVNIVKFLGISLIFIVGLGLTGCQTQLSCEDQGYTNNEDVNDLINYTNFLAEEVEECYDNEVPRLNYLEAK